MKKLFIMAIVAATMMSCGGKQQSTEEKADVNEFSDIAKGVADESNARTSLDVDGTYAGVTPAADAEGIDVVITLAGDNYTKKISYVGKKGAPVETKGNFTWDAAGNTITLVGEQAPNQYFVSENVLIQLDTEGKKITGELADHYRLAKK